MSVDGGAGPNGLKVDAAQAERLHKFALDLKNRLNGMGTSLRMLHELPEGPERNEVRDYAERAYFKALFDLETVLDDLGVERGPSTSRNTAVDLAELARSMAEELGHRTNRKEQSLVLDLPERMPAVGDADLLRQVIGTLLSNASKFSATGSTITVRPSIGKGCTGLAVSDRGAGMDDADRPLVFKAYAWLSSRSTAGEEQGRASLARAFRAMRAQGGTLEMHSEGTGRGSTFTLLLPTA
jgi:signal transduction histidine kinase